MPVSARIKRPETSEAYTDWPGFLRWEVKPERSRRLTMNKTRTSLFYLGSYLAIIGFGLLFVPNETLKILQSNGDYSDVFPRVAGMLMS
jgi:hypothetical protein